MVLLQETLASFSAAEASQVANDVRPTSAGVTGAQIDRGDDPAPVCRVLRAERTATYSLHFERKRIDTKNHKASVPSVSVCHKIKKPILFGRNLYSILCFFFGIT